MSTPNAKFAADRIALKLRKVNPEWCIPFDEIVQDAIDADNARLTAALSTAEKERDAAKAWHREASEQVMALTAERDGALKIARHTHVNSGIKGVDTCRECGFDLRHIIHRTQP